MPVAAHTKRPSSREAEGGLATSRETPEMHYNLTGHSRLTEALRKEHGLYLEQRCNGRGTCGGCRVNLVSGRWEVSGKEIQAPCANVLGCQTRLLSEEGTVDISPSLLAHAVCRETGLTGRKIPMKPGCGAVVGLDLGSTTVVGALAKDGIVLREASVLNRQTAYGADVMSRITHCQQHEKGLDELREAALLSLREVFLALCEDGTPVERIVVAGNTVMMCILNGVSPVPIGTYPFQAPKLEFPDISAREWMLDCDARVSFVPCASGFIGGDVVCGLLQCPLQPGEALVDVGTNCEMVFNAGGRLLAVSASAGPAFEGGMDGFTLRAVPGAVNHSRDDGAYTVVGEEGVWHLPGDGFQAAGLCGTGVIDALAVLRRRGMLTASGQCANGTSSLQVAGLELAAEAVSSIQLAKAAVASGIKIVEMLGKARCERVYLAGLFGEHLGTSNAVAIGMLPDVPCVKVGNTSLSGALMLACDDALLPLARDVAGRISVYNLSEQEGYERVFIEGLML